MELNSPPKLNPVSTHDRISDLPENIIDSILIRLPIREAIRTSILSSKWRYKWLTISQLIFNDDDDEQVSSWNFENIVNSILLLHEGQIHKFSVSVNFIPSFVYQWLHYLSKNGVKEINLEYHGDEIYQVPCYLFSCQQLTRLSLYNCTLPTSRIMGFYSLTRLTLYQVPISNDVFETLILSCPLLERLNHSSFSAVYFSLLRIPAPKLKYLRLACEFGDLCLESNPLLEVISISLCDGYHTNLEHRTCTSMMNRVLGCLPRIRKLEFNSSFLKLLATGKVPSRLPTPYNHLETLQLFDIMFDDLDVISVTLCLIRSSPKLRQLEIWACTEPYAVLEPGLDIFNAHYHSDFSFNQLRIMEMTNIQVVRFELEFIKFVLVKAPFLEMMTLKPCESNKVKVPLMKELLQIPRASAQARIIYLGPDQV